MGIKYSINEKFFDKWSDKMAYVLGFFYADGSMEDASYLRGKYIRFSSTDGELLNEIKMVLKSQHKIYKSPSYGTHKAKYLLRIGSHKLYKSLEKIGLYPNKSLTIQLPKIPKKYFFDFLRGYLDGDGCIYLEMAKGKKQEKIIKKLSTIFTSGSKIFLEELKEKLNNYCKIDKKYVYNSRRSYQLRYGTADSLKILDLIYKNKNDKLFLKRKYQTYQKYLEMKNGRMVK
ncbi:MAG TPA: hypothetical protein DEB09_05950 [Candidatus Magasanikbacteria bacterium]|nr:hypothetical protein [Candidatus Magasanikbacteria bacterium]